MKKSLFVLLAGAAILAGCQSKEEKAAELIKEELSKTLIDFESYQPIETKVKEAKLSLYNDTAFWRKGAVLAYTMKKSSEYLDKAKDAERHMNIWGPPTAYSSSYSDKQYYEYKKEYEDANTNALSAAFLCKALANSLRDSIAKCDTSKVIGWEVSHRFRCKTRGGNSTIADYRYIIDKNFETVLLREDTEDKEDAATRTALETVLSDYWDDLFN